MTGDGTTGPYPRLSPAPIVTDMDRIERRKADHYDKQATCHYCPFTDRDAEKVYAHLWTHSEIDRRSHR